MCKGMCKQGRLAILIEALCLCIVICAAGGVYAYLTANTGPLTNEFVPAKVSCIVEETFADGVKSDVKVRNTGNIDAYIRAAVVVNFVSEEGKVFAAAPKEGVDYSIAWSAAGWAKGADGYWYHIKPVTPDGVTAPLIDTASAISVPVGYRLQIQILAAGVQSAPDAAVQEAWGVTVMNGEIVPN